LRPGRLDLTLPLVSAPACERCGSEDLRRKRPRGPWAKLHRAITGRHRYACNACYHRGWTRGVVPSGAPGPDHGRTAQQPGRPLEHRDLVAERRLRVARTIGVVVALALGGLLAGFIGWALS
jgi:hypothetical protein